LAVIEESTDAKQNGRKRISFLAEIEEPDSDQDAYHDHGYDFEHGVESGNSADRTRARQTVSLRKGSIGPQHREHAKQDGRPAKYEHCLILVRLRLTATLTLNGG
jgi:hypothetical protein